MNKFWSKDVLDFVDAWACRPGQEHIGFKDGKRSGKREH